jgi:hypothetical protein
MTKDDLNTKALLEALAEIWVDWTMIELVHMGLIRSNIIKNVTTTVDPKTLTVTMHLPEYAKYIESGRRPGAKRPPFRMILQWVRKKFGSQDANRRTWAICGAIAKRGIKARPFIEKASEKAVREAMEKFPNLLQLTVDPALRKLFYKS